MKVKTKAKQKRSWRIVVQPSFVGGALAEETRAYSQLKITGINVACHDTEGRKPEEKEQT